MILFNHSASVLTLLTNRSIQNACNNVPFCGQR